MRLTKVGAVFSVLGLTMAGANAQDFRGGPPAGGPPPGLQQVNPGVRPFPNPQSAPPEFQVASNLRGLLRRPEVQMEIGLDLKQRNAINESQDGNANAIRERIKAALQGQDAQFRNMSQDQRRQWVERQQRELAAEMESAARAQGDLDAKVKQILRPEQLVRLGELDLQKRGPLALGDARVAQDLKLSAQTRNNEARILSDYQSTMRMIVGEAMQDTIQSGAAAKGKGPDFESRLSPHRKKLEANKVDSEKRALEALSEEELASWRAAQGKPFQFRPDPAPQRPRQPAFRRNG